MYNVDIQIFNTVNFILKAIRNRSIDVVRHFIDKGLKLNEVIEIRSSIIHEGRFNIKCFKCWGGSVGGYIKVK